MPSFLIRAAKVLKFPGKQKKPGLLTSVPDSQPLTDNVINEVRKDLKNIRDNIESKDDDALYDALDIIDQLKKRIKKELAK